MIPQLQRPTGAFIGASWAALLFRRIFATWRFSRMSPRLLKVTESVDKGSLGAYFDT